MVQCPRDTRCLKEKGHKGWCRTTGEKEWEEPPKRSGRGSAASSKVAKMQALGAKREHQAARSGGDADASDSDEGDGDVEYEDFGVTQAERRAARSGGHSAAAYEEEEEEQGEDWSGPAAAPDSFESIRLPRQRLELWQLEPFFDQTVVGCLVRIGLGQTETGGSGLYRLAEVVAVAEDLEKPYSLGSRRCTKRLQLEFGECRRFYPMTSVRTPGTPTTPGPGWGVGDLPALALVLVLVLVLAPALTLTLALVLTLVLVLALTTGPDPDPGSSPGPYPDPCL